LGPSRTGSNSRNWQIAASFRYRSQGRPSRREFNQSSGHVCFAVDVERFGGKTQTGAGDQGRAPLRIRASPIMLTNLDLAFEKPEGALMPFVVKTNLPSLGEAAMMLRTTGTDGTTCARPFIVRFDGISQTGLVCQSRSSSRRDNDLAGFAPALANAVQRMVVLTSCVRSQPTFRVSLQEPVGHTAGRGGGGHNWRPRNPDDLLADQPPRQPSPMRCGQLFFPRSVRCPETFRSICATASQSL